MASEINHPHFDGSSYNSKHDQRRLGNQLERVLNLMSDGHWRGLEEIARTIRAPHASVSTRLRDLRKPRFGAHMVERRRLDDPKAGLWVYRLVPRSMAPTEEVSRGQ